MNHILHCGCEIKWSYYPRSYERNFSNNYCVERPEKFRTSTGFEPVTSRHRYDALTNWAMKPLTLGAGHLWIQVLNESNCEDHSFTQYFGCLSWPNDCKSASLFLSLHTVKYSEAKLKKKSCAHFSYIFCAWWMTGNSLNSSIDIIYFHKILLILHF